MTVFSFRETNADGRASAFLTWEQFEPGTYKMKFDIKEYFERKNNPYNSLKKLDFHFELMKYFLE